MGNSTPNPSRLQDQDQPLHQGPYLSRRSAMTLLGAGLFQSVLPAAVRAATDPDWTTPVPPYRIAGNLYYVGSRDLASFLITTPAGHILINSNLISSPPQIRAGIEKLGFHYRDLKILLISHAHSDHCSGSARIQKETDASYVVMEGDAEVVESGGKLDFHYGRRAAFLYPAVKVDQVLKDCNQIKLGGTTLTAHKTAGHTKGCTTWTMTVPAPPDGRTLNAVIVGGPNVNPGYNLIDDPRYPQMAADYIQQFCTLHTLPCDLFLGAHGQYYDMLAKAARLQAGHSDAFVDPVGYKAYIEDRQKAFQAELDRQTKAHRKP